MNEEKLEETSENTSLFHSNTREPWRATRLLHQQRLKQKQQQHNHHRQQQEQHEHCCADQTSITHQQHKKVLFHHQKQQQTILYQHHHQQQQRQYFTPSTAIAAPTSSSVSSDLQQQRLQKVLGGSLQPESSDLQQQRPQKVLGGSLQTESSVINVRSPRSPTPCTIPAVPECVFCSGGRGQGNLITRGTFISSDTGIFPHTGASSSSRQHIYTSACSSDCKHLPTISDDNVVLIWNARYCRSFQGIVRLLQVILSVVSLVCLTTSGRHEGGYLSLPLCWHFRIMVFILVLTLLSSFIIWAAHATGLASAFPINWHFLDMIVYSVFAFLYLVGASLVASAFDFYEKMQVGVGHQTIRQLILSVIIGYICLFLYGTTAVIGYRQWRIQMKQYQHRKLLEEDDFEI